MSNNTILELKAISKQYPGVLALDNVNMEFEEGEVHALVGQNGAGKSTLIKVCTGAISPSSGHIIIDGNEYEKLDPKLSESLGIAAVYQELNLVNELSIAENVFLGQREAGHRLFDRKIIEKKSAELMVSLGFDVDVRKPVKELSAGVQQMVEIAKSLHLKKKILILDEPTAALANAEVEKLFEIIKKLKDMNITVIYISHRLEEIFRIADRLTVFRDGKKIITKNVADTDQEELISLMVGRKMTEVYPKYEGKPSEEVILETKNLSGNGVKDISFSVRRGEILGFGGLVGAGRTELAQMLFGMVKPESGEIIVKGDSVVFRTVNDAIAKGIALVPEDRKHQGLVLPMSIGENIALPSLKNISKFTVINSKKEQKLVKKYSEALQIKASNIEYPANTLSGGNQQKIVLAKWLAMLPDLIILDEPTRGIDVAAKYEIYLLMHEMLRNGKALIMISSETEELINMSTRIVVLCEGRKTGELNKEDFDEELILKYASTVDKSEVHQ